MDDVRYIAWHPAGGHQTSPRELVLQVLVVTHWCYDRPITLERARKALHGGGAAPTRGGAGAGGDTPQQEGDCSTKAASSYSSSVALPVSKRGSFCALKLAQG